MSNHLIIVTGHYGSGKTEFAVNLAFRLAREGNAVMLADLENCSLSFTELTEKLSALGAEMDIAIRMQREDIFNAMHKI